MLQLLQAFTGKLQFFVWRLLGLLDEGVKHDDPFAQHEAIERAADARLAFGSKLKQAVTECSGMWQAKAGPMLSQQLN
jgi:hypothetical protein